MALLLLSSALLAISVTSQPCDSDVSSNCEDVTQGGKEEFCTNTDDCPTCGDYMAEMCRFTCREWISECESEPVTPVAAPTKDPGQNNWGEECYMTGVRWEAPELLIESREGVNHLGKCQNKCDKLFGCAWIQYRKEDKTCELMKLLPEGPAHEEAGWVVSSKECEVRRMLAILDEVPPSVAYLAAAGAFVAALGVVVFVIRGKKQTPAEYEALSVA